MILIYAFGFSHLKFNQKSVYQLSAIFYFVLQSYSTRSPEFTGLKLEIKFLFICSFIFCWIRNNNSGYEPRQKFRIHNTEKRIYLKEMSTISLTYNGKHEDIPVDGLSSLGILLSRVNLHQI